MAQVLVIFPVFVSLCKHPARRRGRQPTAKTLAGYGLEYSS